MHGDVLTRAADEWTAVDSNVNRDNRFSDVERRKTYDFLRVAEGISIIASGMPERMTMSPADASFNSTRSSPKWPSYLRNGGSLFLSIAVHMDDGPSLGDRAVEDTSTRLAAKIFIVEEHGRLEEEMGHSRRLLVRNGTYDHVEERADVDPFIINLASSKSSKS